MKKDILIIDNGFKIHKPFIIKSFEKNSLLKVNVIYNFINKKKFSIIERVFNKLRIPIDSSNFNKRIINSVIKYKPELIFIIKGNNIYKRTLKRIKAINKHIFIVSWTADNMIKKHNTSYYFENSIPEYDIHFTTKSNIINELYSAGAKKVKFLNKAFSIYDHFPEVYDKVFDYNVLFIGSAEDERYLYMKYLSENGIKVNIFGNMWGNKYKSNENLIIHRKELIGLNYRKAISSSKITLCFLRKINDDLQTDRTMEIPACRGLMLAERTEEHLKLFKEGIEAVYFESKEELLEKVKFYLKNVKLADQIKKNGYEKCINSKYNFDEMIRKILNEV